MTQKLPQIFGTSDSVPEVVIARLPQYIRALNKLNTSTATVTNSRQLGEMLQVTPDQIRKDLSYFGRFGKQGRGYSVALLLEELKHILGLNSNWNVIVVGMGRLGTAILSYPGFTPDGFRLVAAVDSDRNLIGQVIQGIMVKSSDDLSQIIRDYSIDIAIVAVPIEYTQSVINSLVHYGIRAILNYASISPQVPDGVRIQNIDPVLSLQSMTYYLNN